MRIIVDSVDKRMTVPLIDQLKEEGYDVFGIGFKGGKALNGHCLNKIYWIDKADIGKDLSEVFLDFNGEDVLIAGNPLIIEAVNTLEPDIRYLLPESLMVDKANDKESLGSLAESLGIPYPRPVEDVKVGTIAKLKCSENTSLKPAQRYRIIDSEKDLLNAEAFLKDHQGNLIFQEYVKGSGYGVSMLLDEKSRLVDFICHERLLEYPISGGPSALCQTVYDEKLVKHAYDLLSSLKWTGFAMVEFKGDHLIEINPRFWGSMPLIFKADSKFFINYINVLRGQAKIIQDSDIPYKVGRRMGYFPQGLVAIISHAKSGELSKAIKGLGLLTLSKEGIFSLRNPKPFFNYVKGLLSR